MSMRPQSHKKKWRYIGGWVVTLLSRIGLCGWLWMASLIFLRTSTNSWSITLTPSQSMLWLAPGVHTQLMCLWSVYPGSLGWNAPSPWGVQVGLMPSQLIYLITHQDPFLRSHDYTWGSSVGQSRPDVTFKMSWNGWVSGSCVYNIYHRFLWLGFAAC